MKYKNFYLFSLVAVLSASAYPIYMGAVMMINCLKSGSINVADYPEYIIPYTPISIALIASTAIMPLLFKLFKRYTLPVVSFLGILIFFAFELVFEQIPVIDNYENIKLQSWQFFLCYSTPEVLRSMGKPIYAANNPAFKVHFYIISIVIILAVLYVIYGFSKMLREQNFAKMRPLIAQTISVVIFIALCIFACLTAFYRNGTLYISPLSSSLMSLFFIVFGITVGTYVGSILYGRSRFLSKLIPSICASATTLVMYIGELLLMNGILFKFGLSFFFTPIGSFPFAPADLCTILCSGLITYFIMLFLNKTHKKTGNEGNKP